MAGSLVKVIYNENSSFDYKAQIFNDGNMHVVRYYGPGEQFIREEYLNESDIGNVEQIARSRINEVKILNG